MLYRRFSLAAGFIFISYLTLTCVTPSSASAQDTGPLVEQYLKDGKLAAGEEALKEHLQKNGDDQQARFGLGTLQFLRAVEGLGQSLYKFGAVGGDSDIGNFLPIVRMAVPQNPNPAPIDYASFRNILQTFAEDLAAAEKTLAHVDDPDVQLPLHFGTIRMDLNDDGELNQEETLWRVYASLNRGLRLNQTFTPEQAEEFVIDFDLADAYWLRGYCHLLTAICDTLLAYDFEATFKYVARHTFAKVTKEMEASDVFDKHKYFDAWPISEAIAAIHVARFELVEPMRMQAARQHLLQVVELSRKTWEAVEAETDDRAEWLPGPHQSGVIPNVRITPEMLRTWHDFLAESEQLLNGEKLVPHWQIKNDYGVNLKRIFDEPTDFDFVLWLHGDGLLSYIEEGEITSRETWDQFNRMFRGQFIGFALWFN